WKGAAGHSPCRRSVEPEQRSHCAGCGRGLKIGLIGYGAWGRHHAAAIAESGEFELTAVCSQSEPSRRAASDKWGVPTVADYRELLARTELDAVDIVLPTHLHREVAAAALEGGK